MSSCGGRAVAGNRHDGNLIDMRERGFIGTCFRPTTGKMERKRFTTTSQRQAIEEWADWCESVRAAEQEKMAARCKLKTDVADATVTEMEVPNMEKDNTAEKKCYVLTVVGGGPLCWFDDKDKAFAVCDALTAAAKASGFAAQYDVSPIKKWVA